MTLLVRAALVSLLLTGFAAGAQTVPSLANPVPGATTLSGTGQAEGDAYKTVEVYICGSATKPANPLPDCSDEKTDVLPLANGAAKVEITDAGGKFQATLTTPLAANSFVWAIQKATPKTGAPVNTPTKGPEQVLPASVAPLIGSISRTGDTVTISGVGQSTTPDGYATNVYACVLPAGPGAQLMASGTAPDCSPSGTYAALAVQNKTTGADGSFFLQVTVPKNSGDYVAVTQVATLVNGSAAPAQSTPVRQPRYDGVCQYEFNDCDFIWSLLGGIEQADLSSQSSQTEGFVDFFVRAPWNARLASAWLLSRFLGAPASTNTLNVVTAATSASGFTTAQLPQTVFAVDYMIGYEHDFRLPGEKNPGSGMFTFGPIAALGATTPLDSSTASVAYKVPDYGTNECNQLQQRFGAPFTIGTATGSGTPATYTSFTLTGKANPNGYAPALPPPGYASGGATPACVVQPPPGSSSATPSSPGTQITTIAFSNQDRTSFLLKWEAGFRFINRWHSGSSQHCSSWSPGSQGHEKDGPCLRMIADVTIGQDQDITAGYLRHFVLKNDIVVPLGKKGLFFFGDAQNRIEHNKNYSPLILNSVPIATGPNPPTGSVTIPSSSVFVLPLKQSDRDYYRIGFGIDVTTLMKAWF